MYQGKNVELPSRQNRIWHLSDTFYVENQSRYQGAAKTVTIYPSWVVRWLVAYPMSRVLFPCAILDHDRVLEIRQELKPYYFILDDMTRLDDGKFDGRYYFYRAFFFFFVIIKKYVSIFFPLRMFYQMRFFLL